MTALALLLVLLAAVLHASWNLLAKRARGGVAFTWLFSALTLLLWAPVVGLYLWLWPPVLHSFAWLAMAGSATIHVGYCLMLQQGYRSGDLSVVYPLARGTGPLLSLLGAILLLGERPSLLSAAGAALIVAGVFFVAGGEQSMRAHAAGARYGLLTGLLIACYTLWDKHAVSTLLVPPLLLEYGSNAGRMLLLTPLAWPRRSEVHAAWRQYRLEAAGIALLSSLAYILVLTALATAPVSYIAPARELSILFGALFGTLLLKEGQSQRRLWAAGVMVAGVVLLALG